MRLAAPGRHPGPNRLEGLIWALFAQSAVLTALVVPAHILVQGVLGPLGVVPSFDHQYSTFAGALSNWLVKLYFFVVFGSTFWVLAHRVRYTLLELSVPGGKQRLGLLTYGLAVLATLIAGYVLVTVP
jgi:fumarate reductase subunit D